MLTTLACLALAVPAFSAQPLRPRPAVIKPARTVFEPSKHDANRLSVKLRDDLPVRLRDNKLTDGGSGQLEKAANLLNRLEASGAVWQRQHLVSEEKLDEMRATAQHNTSRAMPDLNTAYVIELPNGLDASQAADDLNALEIVEIAQPMPLPSPLPVVRDYEPSQGALNAAPVGVDAKYAWTQPGGNGADVRIADIEYLWNLNHADVSATLVGPAPSPPSFNNVPVGADHGTAVLGEMAGRRDGAGVTGIAYGSTFLVAASRTSSGFNPAAAITTAAAALRAGDVMILEMQTDGPAAGTTDYVPIEWVKDVYDAIVTAVGNGIIVVEAAGNGAQNLDDPIFSTGNNGHWPFLPANDSGAIIVGAGAAPADSVGDRTRLSFSSYGSTVDLQGWGESVYTAGYGDLYSADGTNRLYTAVFNGTSSATPIVTAACAALQGAFKARTGGGVLSPRELREIFRATGSPQQSGSNPVTQNIGPRPNLAAAIALAFAPRTWVNFTYGGAEDGTFAHPFNTVPEGVTAVPYGGTVMIKGGTTSWTGVLPRISGNANKMLSLLAFEGPVTIGR